MGLGIGAATAIFSIVNAVLLKPLPYLDPDRIVVFTTDTRQGSAPSAASPAKFNVWREQTNIFQDISAYRYGRVNMTSVEHPEQIRSALVSADYFRFFGQIVSVGRGLTAEEDSPTGGGVVVLSDAFWRRAFGADQRIIGRTITLSGKLHQVIGILAPNVRMESPASFDRANSREPIDAWMPIQIDPNSRDQNGYFSVAARLKPGITLDTAAAHLQWTTHEFHRRFPATDMPPQFAFAVQPMRAAFVSGVPSSLWVLQGAFSLVLLIACANVANLLLMRAAGRKAGDRDPRRSRR